jgi:branched-chain amino acid transport system permease protein
VTVDSRLSPPASPVAVATAAAVEDVVVRFSGVTVLDHVSLQVGAGEIVGVIGPNGSGKTTLLNVMSGFVRAADGAVRWGEQARSVRSTTALVRHGVGRTFQHPILVDELSAVDNVRLSLDRAWRRGSIPQARALLERVRLGVREGDAAVGDLPYGQRRLVDLARALATASRVLLLDEPTAGVGPDDWELIHDVVVGLQSEGVATIVTDHNLAFMGGLCERGAFLHHGKLLAENRMRELLVDPVVVEAYVGTGATRQVRAEIVAEREHGDHEPEGAAVAARSIVAGYRGADVLHEVTVSAQPGEWVGVIGPNGAGKTTVLGCLSGLVTPRAGAITLAGEDLAGRSVRDRVTLGMAHVQEGRRIFKGLSVEDNLRTGATDRADVARRLDEVFELFPMLVEKRDDGAASLSGGQQQVLVIARALMSGPSVLLLDEPTLGLAPVIVAQLLESIGRIVASGVTVVMTDEDARRVIEVVDSAYVLVDGSVRLSGSAARLRDQVDEIEHAYIGGM